MDYLSTSRVMLKYDLPLSEIIYDFFDQLKSRTRVTLPLTMSWAIIMFRIWLNDILINNEIVDALFVCIVIALFRGAELWCKSCVAIPRQLFSAYSGGR